MDRSGAALRAAVVTALLVGTAECRRRPPKPPVAVPVAAAAHGGPSLPLVPVADAPLPGDANRFDYMDVDAAAGRLVLAHMNDGVLLFLDLRDGKVLAELPGLAVVRGVAVAPDVGLVFATAQPDQVVIVDGKAMKEVKRVATGRAPDGIAWDPADRVVGVSDQRDGALSLIADAGSGARTSVKLGTETGNVVWDGARRWFWITAPQERPPDRLFAVEPRTAKVMASIALPGCDGAHGLRLHPDGHSAYVACEGNDGLARVDLDGPHAVVTARTGADPDVLALDPGLGWLYVAAESGDLTVWDTARPGLSLVGHDAPGAHAHSVAVDAATHRVFFPLVAGPHGTPVLRILRPTGT